MLHLSVLLHRKARRAVGADALRERLGVLFRKGFVFRRHLALEVEVDKALHHRHEVLRERPRLVGVELRGGPHCLARLEAPHQVLVLHHLAHGKGEAERDGERQAFRDGHHDDGDAIDEVVEHLHPVPLIVADADDDPADHRRDKGGDGSRRAEATNHDDEVVEALLQSRVLRRVLQLLQDDAPLAAAADGDDEHRARAFRDGGA
mmetsp:Transcript_19954/g.64969  ORF Transcript_19954/g.64969 Transcript_19954/m.64969 type:complete len:205 (-) Transcript_19954:763-1377(-)